MKEIKAYQTSDGKIYKNEDEAMAKQSFIDFLKWYDDNCLYSNGEELYCDAEDLIDWIRMNKDMVLKILAV